MRAGETSGREGLKSDGFDPVRKILVERGPLDFEMMLPGWH